MYDIFVVVGVVEYDFMGVYDCVWEREKEMENDDDMKSILILRDGIDIFIMIIFEDEKEKEREYFDFFEDIFFVFFGFGY